MLNYRFAIVPYEPQHEFKLRAEVQRFRARGETTRSAAASPLGRFAAFVLAPSVAVPTGTARSVAESLAFVRRTDDAALATRLERLCLAR